MAGLKEQRQADTICIEDKALRGCPRRKVMASWKCERDRKMKGTERDSNASGKIT